MLQRYVTRNSITWHVTRDLPSNANKQNYFHWNMFHKICYKLFKEIAHGHCNQTCSHLNSNKIRDSLTTHKRIKQIIQALSSIQIFTRYYKQIHITNLSHLNSLHTIFTTEAHKNILTHTLENSLTRSLVQPICILFELSIFTQPWKHYKP